VLRDGSWISVSSGEIVPGDVIALASGDKVPADARFVEVRDLQIDEAALTGESVPVSKHQDPVPEGAPVADRRSMAYGGTLVSYGSATAVVTATGMETELGRISSMLSEVTGTETPLTRQIATVSKWITVAIAAVAVVLLLVGLLRGYPIVDAAFAGVTLAVAAIPEGLLAVITIALAIGVQRMAQEGRGPQAPCRGDPGQHHRDLHGQDGHVDARRDDRTESLDARSQQRWNILRDRRRRLRPRRGVEQGRRALGRAS
jgi:magnesium-transporting ATPase (P-type)